MTTTDITPGTVTELRDGLTVLVRRLTQAYTAAWARHVPELTAPQFCVLYAVSRHPGADQGSIATLTALDRSSTSDVCKRLEERNLITRTTLIGDGRRKAVSLTPRGAQLLADNIPQVVALETVLTSPPSSTLAGLAGCVPPGRGTDSAFLESDTTTFLTDFTEHVEQLAARSNREDPVGKPHPWSTQSAC